MTEFLVHVCVQKYTAVFRDIFESYSQCLLFQHHVLAPTYYVPLHLSFFLLNFGFSISFFLLALGECQQNPPKVNDENDNRQTTIRQVRRWIVNFFCQFCDRISRTCVCVQKYTAVFRDIFESYSQCLLFQHHVLAPTYYVPLHLIFFLLNFGFFYFLLFTCSWWVSTEPTQSKWWKWQPSDNHQTSAALDRQFFLSILWQNFSYMCVCVQKYTAVFRDIFESYSQCLLFQHHVLAPTYYVPLHLIFFLLNFGFFYFLLFTCSWWVSTEPTQSKWWKWQPFLHLHGPHIIDLSRYSLSNTLLCTSIAFSLPECWVLPLSLWKAGKPKKMLELAWMVKL